MFVSSIKIAAAIDATGLEVGQLSAQPAYLS